MIALAQNLLNIDAIERRELTLRGERVETGPLQDFAVNAHQLAAKVKNIAFHLEGEDLTIRGDLTACRQILTNLVSNAVKYSLPHSSVWIEIRAVAGQRIALSVRDEGPGLSPEDQRMLFRPFTRLSANAAAHEHSVGLGLSIVKLMAEGMGGDARCESELGRGATFTVTLPAWD